MAFVLESNHVMQVRETPKSTCSKMHRLTWACSRSRSSRGSGPFHHCRVAGKMVMRHMFEAGLKLDTKIQVDAVYLAIKQG